MAMSVGKLTITIHRGEFKRNADIGKPMDPYVVLRYGVQIVKTSVKREAGKTPVWNETFKFRFEGRGKLVLSAYDEDVLTRDDKLAQVTVDVPTLVKDGKYEGWIEFDKAGFFRRRTGRLYVTIQVEPGTFTKMERSGVRTPHRLEQPAMVQG
eukprot:GILK01001992.1.p1 GENE.GILK01001992.1~~GILK01001992.1.p1  ORF type:complete len:153 (-),score=7.34 GILK01001992.1:350-808(-)